MRAICENSLLPKHGQRKIVFTVLFRKSWSTHKAGTQGPARPYYNDVLPHKWDVFLIDSIRNYFFCPRFTLRDLEIHKLMFIEMV